MSAWQPLETLDDAFAKLKVAWDAASEGWDDSVHDEFECEHWGKFESEVPSFRGALEELVKVLTDARSSVRME